MRLNIVADDADMLAATDEHIDLHRELVDQADRLFGARHFNHYDFLLAVTDKLGGIGLEHHRSSENSVDTEILHRLARAPWPTATCWATNTPTPGTANGGGPPTS